jgi:5-methylcytosine-specific restriction endonuclease McrA
MDSGIYKFSYIFDLLTPTGARKAGQLQIETRWRGQRNSCWTDDKRMLFIELVLQNYTVAPIYLVKTKNSNGSEFYGVLDGAHRIETLRDFLNGSLKISKFKGKGWETSKLKQYDGFSIKELPTEIQELFDDYKIHVNRVSDDVASSPDKLAELFVRLNEAGVPANGYERDAPIFGDLQRYIEQEVSPNWVNTKIFTKSESKRGALEEKLFILLALSHSGWKGSAFPGFSSLPTLSKKWRESFGKTVDAINDHIGDNKQVYGARLNVMRNILKELEDNRVLLEDVDHTVPLIICIGRLGCYFSDISTFNRSSKGIFKLLKDRIFSLTPEALAKVDGGDGSRNAKFQKKIVRLVDSIIEEVYVDTGPRKFSPAMQKIAHKQQNGECASCRKKTPLTKCEGDHIEPYSTGGKTVQENLQMLCRPCHRAKTKEMYD